MKNKTSLTTGQILLIIIISLGLLLLIFERFLYPSSDLALFIGHLKSQLGKKQPLDILKWKHNLRSLSAFCFILAPLLGLSLYWHRIQYSKLISRKIFWVIVIISSILSFSSSLVINFFKHSFSDGWFTSIAQLLNHENLLYRDIKFWVTPLTVIIAYYLNFLGNMLIWEKLFGFAVLLIIWFGLWRINFLLTRNLFISLAFTAISISLGQMFVATVYYEYNVLTIMIAILIFLAENARLNSRKINSFRSDCLWLGVIGLLSGFSILTKYTDGVANLLFILIYYCIYFTKSIDKRKNVSFQKYLIKIAAFWGGLIGSILIAWFLSFFIVDFYYMPSSILEISKAKGGAGKILLKIIHEFPYRFFSGLFDPLKKIIIDPLTIFNALFLRNFLRAILPGLLFFNVFVMTHSLYFPQKKDIFSKEQRWIALLMSLLALGAFITTLMSNGNGGWDSLRYFYNVIPVSIICLISLNNTRKFKVTIFKLSGIILSLIAIPLSYHKVFYLYTWFYGQERLNFRNIEVSASGYYSFLPMDRNFRKVVNEICSTIDDSQAVIISYPMPFANIACDHKFPLKQAIFWYDVADPKEIKTLLQWLQYKHNSPVYIVYFHLQDPQVIQFHESSFGPKHYHRKLESYLLSQEISSNKSSQYILIKQIPYQGTIVKIYKTKAISN